MSTEDGRLGRTGTRAIAVVAWSVAIGACVIAAAIRAASGAPPLENRFQFGDASLAAFIVLVVAFATVGTVLAGLRPRHPIGWLMLVTGLGYGVQMAAVAYLSADVAVQGRVGPQAAWAGWLTDLSGYVAGGAMFGTFAVFPDGRVPLRAWARLKRPVVAAGVLIFVLSLTVPGPLWHFPSIENPAGVAWADFLLTWLGVLRTPAGFGLLWVPTIALLVGRARTADRVVRQQLKWFGLAAILTTVSLAVAASLGVATSGASPLGELPLTLTVVSAPLIPLAIGVAILRYRLYDIDVAIRRTLVYGAVVVILAGVYVALVLGLQAALTSVTGSETLPVALSTLAIAALFGPVRARVRAIVDRRFYRSRYDAQRTLEAFGVQLRDQVELDEVGRLLVVVAGDAVRPATASVWVRSRQT